MATQLAGLDPGHPSLYPWDEWCDGNAWGLKHGEDFQLDPGKFQRYCYTVASRRGMSLRTTRRGDVVQVQFSPKDQEVTDGA